MSNTSELYNEFYKYFIDELKKRGEEFPEWFKIPKHKEGANSLGYKVGISDIEFYTEYTTKGYSKGYKGFIVGVVMDSDNYIKKYNYLKKYKDEIEEKLNRKLEWVETKKACRIFIIERDKKVDDKEYWNEIIKFQIDNLIKIIEVFKPYIDNMKIIEEDEVNLGEFKKYLQKIGMKKNTIDFYSSHITTGLAILKKIDEFKNLDEIEMLKLFSNKDNNYRDDYDKYHTGGIATFNDNRSVSRAYVNFLNYKLILETIKEYDDNSQSFSLNNAHWYFKIFNDNNTYPVKAIIKKIQDKLDLKNDFTTNNAKGLLKKIFKDKIVFIDMKIEVKSCSKTKNIILYGVPGVGKTYSHKKLIDMIESKRYGDKAIFRTLESHQKEEKYDEAQSENRVKFVTFHQSFGYEDFIEGYRPNESGNIELERGVFKSFCVKAQEEKDKKFYFVIDEINRGNISKIFGELITLIEEDKRDSLHVELPYSKKSFSIPSNLYIIGTMNSTDKSIALIDIALRRRFTFLKMVPNPELVENHEAKELMKALNEKLDDEHKIGHSYFMDIKSDDELEFVCEYKIKPLLEEYFYGDSEKLEEIKNLLPQKN